MYCHACVLSCVWLCDSMDHNLLGSSVHGIVQARILEWLAISSSRVSSWPRDQIHGACIAGGFFTSEPPGKPHRHVLLLLLSRLSCPTLCNPLDGSPPGSAIPGILQARTLEWIAISFSNAWKWKVKVKLLSHVQLFAYQAPPSMGLSRQEYWSGLPLPSLR